MSVVFVVIPFIFRMSIAFIIFMHAGVDWTWQTCIFLNITDTHTCIHC